MKNYVLIIFSTIIINTPVFAACPLGGACAPVTETGNQSMEMRFIPDNINQIKQPYTLNSTINNPYNNAGTDTVNVPDRDFGQRNFERNCQFGVCLP